MHDATRSGGYSLTEIALVMGITGLLTALATPLFLNYYQGSRLRAAAEQVASLLNQGRELGIRENAGSCIHVGAASLQYFVGTSCAGAAWVGAGTDAAGNIALPGDIALTTTADPVFSYLGRRQHGRRDHRPEHAGQPDPHRDGGRVRPREHRPMSRAGRALVDQRGMTIAEVLVAVGIIGVGLLAVCSAIPIGAYAIQEGNQLSTATFLAGQRMEQVRNARWAATDPVAGAAVDRLGVSASASAAPVGDGAAVTFPDESPMASPYANYTRTVRIVNCNAAPGCDGALYPGLRRVTVTVSYRPMTGVGPATNTATKSSVLTMDISQR